MPKTFSQETHDDSDDGDVERERDAKGRESRGMVYLSGNSLGKLTIIIIVIVASVEIDRWW